jgi:hypothetical protein
MKNLVKNTLKALPVFAVLFIIALALTKAPKGSDYIKWEKEMIESGQIKK